MTSINVDTLDGIFNPSYKIAQALYDSDEEDGDLPEAFCKEGFNPSYIMTESRYGEKVMAESRYGENAMAETVREDDVGMVEPPDSLQKEGNALIAIQLSATALGYL